MNKKSSSWWWSKRGDRRRVHPQTQPSSKRSEKSNVKKHTSGFMKRLRSTDGFGEGLLPMYLVRLSSMIHRYGGRKYPKLATFETLKREGEIFEYKELPKESTKVYVSHEWLSRNHADPKGIHTRNLVRILTSLGKGKFEVSMDPFHTIIYGESRTTTKAEWKKLSPESTYIWFDWCCVPAQRREDAMRSIHVFIRRSNFVLTLVPGAKHEDRFDLST